MNNTVSDIKLEPKLVGKIQGNFYIPSYQRGYRWGKEEVARLLDDIYTNGTNNYCLQPVVVRRKEDGSFELIDGQQRLTTIYLIYKYINRSTGGFFGKVNFTLIYQNRTGSQQFLSTLDKAHREDYIDYWFIYQAYETIDAWFSNPNIDKENTLIKFVTYFKDNVSIIWYEVEVSDEEAVALFERLNIGKIPLTSAELVKAMFLSCANIGATDWNKQREKQNEIALQWDNIEKELHDDSLWYFLTNQYKSGYQTRIDLILDLIASKPANSKEKYFTFFYFDELNKELQEELQKKPKREQSLDGMQNLDAIWKKIQHTFLILKDWHENHELYHKIGYLIASGDYSLQDIYIKYDGVTKTEFKNILDNCIRDSIKNDSNYAELSYEKQKDYHEISKLLLLFNVESVRQIDGQTQRFPFHQFKYQKGGKVAWSLEHIHAQQSEGMKTQEEWKEWLRLHKPFIEALPANPQDLTERMEKAMAKPKLERSDFEKIKTDIVALLSLERGVEYMHSIANLALLSKDDNAALNNSTFAVKRNEIVKLDKAGQYIPLCTKRVFLKYYTPSEKNQLHFWGQADRIAYVDNINKVLGNYLGDNKIIAEKETV